MMKNTYGFAFILTAFICMSTQLNAKEFDIETCELKRNRSAEWSNLSKRKMYKSSEAMMGRCPSTLKYEPGMAAIDIYYLAGEREFNGGISYCVYRTLDISNNASMLRCKLVE